MVSPQWSGHQREYIQGSSSKILLIYRDSLVLLDLLVPLDPVERRQVPEHDHVEL